MSKRVTPKSPKVKIVFASEYFEAHASHCFVGCKFNPDGYKGKAVCVVKCATGANILKEEMKKDIKELDQLRQMYQDRLNEISEVDLPDDATEAV